MKVKKILYTIPLHNVSANSANSANQCKFIVGAQHIYGIVEDVQFEIEVLQLWHSILDIL